MWDLFYKRNSTHFFKDRHWTLREFEEIKEASQAVSFEYLVVLFFKFVILANTFSTTDYMCAKTDQNMVSIPSLVTVIANNGVFI